MTALVLALALVQSPWQATPRAVTVGDTVIAERILPAPDPSAQIRLGPLAPSDVFAPLRAPTVERRGGVRAQYLLAVFEPGTHQIAMPDIELVYPDGRLETIPGGVVTVRVGSLLPAGDSLPPPRPVREPVMRRVVHAAPAVWLAAGVLLLFVAWGWWRRRAEPRPAWAVAETPSEAFDLPLWLSAGEPRAVATVTLHRLRSHVAGILGRDDHALDIEGWLREVRHARPVWPLDECREVARSLERASFAAAVPIDMIALADETEMLLRRIDEIETAAAIAREEAARGGEEDSPSGNGVEAGLPPPVGEDLD